ncbi:hypothetical protein [Bacillus pumilus]|uniref:hypothetical protein n=1 Tax=Bacillus pumilus TaxID=1408 RepID=UPI0016426919|nr:hypothetical protein [Bacillus pumilus]
MNNKVAYMKWSDMFDRSTIKIRTNGYDKVGEAPGNYFDDYLSFPYEIHNELAVLN